MAKVDTKHPDYVKWEKRWQRCRDAVEGADVVKKRGREYLPQLGGQDDEEYLSYVKRALWYNASGRTVRGLSGLIFRKDIILEGPAPILAFADDLDMAGHDLSDVANQVVENVITVGRDGMLIDYPRVDNVDELTQAELDEIGARPYAKRYRAEDIVNWRTEYVGGRTVVTQIVLYEEEPKPGRDEFSGELIPQYRVLRLDGGVYRQIVYRKVEGRGFEVYEEITPLMGGSPLPFIPFVFFSARDTSPDVSRPPLLDLVDMNLSHYRTMADLENGCHWTGVPTPVISGVSDQETVRLGSSEALILNNPEAKAYMLEFTGEGLSALEARAKSKEEQMAVLGARILAQEGRMVEAAETAAIHRAGESADLAAIAHAVERGLERVLKIMARWVGANEEAVNVSLNTDYMPTPMSPQMLQQLTAALQSGAISHVDYYEYLKRGEIIDESKSLEETREELETYPPLGGAGAAGDLGGVEDEL